MTDLEYLKKYFKGDLDEAIEKLNRNIPVQYIVGNVDFHDLNFDINENVLIPRFETEELVSKLISYVKEYFDKKISLIDIGTGSGCIAITLDKKLNADVDAIDISFEALEVAKRNNIKNNAHVNFFKSDIFSNVNKKYDVIVSNPPYIAYNEEIMDIVKYNEPSIALYADDNGLYFYKEILKNAKKYLNEKAIIAFEIGSSQALEIKNICLTYFKDARVIISKDLGGFDRFVFIFI